MSVLPASMNVHNVYMPGPSGIGVIDNYELSCGFWGVNPSPLQEQQKLLTTEPPCQLPSPYPYTWLLSCFVADAVVGEEEPEVGLLIARIIVKWQPPGQGLRILGPCPCSAPGWLGQFREFTPWLRAYISRVIFQLCPPNNCAITVFGTISGLALWPGVPAAN